MKYIWIALLLASVANGAVAPSVTPLGSYGQSLQSPSRVATDTAGNLYVVDAESYNIVVFDAFGRIADVRGYCTGALGIAVDGAGLIYLADGSAGCVSVLDPSWNLLYQLGAGTNEFQMPNYIALDPVSNTVYVTDSIANAVKVYSGGTLITQFGAPGKGNGQFDFPAGVWVSTNGEVFVVDQSNGRIQVFTRDGTYLRKIDYSSSGPTGRPQGCVGDNVGRLYVVDAYQGSVRVHDAASTNTTPLSTVGSFGSGLGQLKVPSGVALDKWGRLLVASANSARVEIFGLDSFVHLGAFPSGGVIAAGTNLVFNAVTGGSGPFSFRWLKDGIGITDATNAMLTIEGVGSLDAGGYSVVIDGTTSSVASVSVMLPPRILADPQGAIVFRGSNVTFAVSTDGSDLTYQWQLDGRDIQGATNNTLSLVNTQGRDSGSYGVRVQNAVGAVTSAPAALTVLLPPWVMEILAFGVQPDQTKVLTFNADPGLSYQIESSTDLTNWAPAVSFSHYGGISDFIDADSTNETQRFYRLRWLP